MLCVTICVESGRGFKHGGTRVLLCNLFLNCKNASSYVLAKGEDDGHGTPVWSQATLPMDVLYGSKCVGKTVNIEIQDGDMKLVGVISAETEIDYRELTAYHNIGMWVPVQNSEYDGSVIPEVYVTFSRKIEAFQEERISAKVKESQQHRVAKVFLSSTFKDMKKEREIIMRKVMVKLKTFCYERSVSLMWVDMRWGITDEMSKGGDTLLACLREVDNSRPYFVGLLGHRYGWHQECDGKDPELVKTFQQAENYSEYKWIKEFRERSVTELEILQGFLLHPSIPSRSLFYFRDPLYLNSVPDNEKRDFEESSEYAKTQLAALKEKIRGSPNCKVTDYTHPEDLEDLILLEMKQMIEQDFPISNMKDEGPNVRTKRHHLNFMQQKNHLFCDRTDLANQLNSVIQQGQNEVIISGESGSGKSSFLSNWCGNLQSNPDTLVLPYFCGYSSESNELVSLLLYLVVGINEFLGNSENYQMKADEETLIPMLANLLQQIRENQRVILVIDAINQLSGPSHQNMGWFPTEIPSEVILIVSSTPNKHLVNLRSSNVALIEVKPLTHSEKTAIMNKQLQAFGKVISDINATKILSHPLSSNPLFLTTVVHEMSTIGIHKNLQKQLESFLGVNEISSLFSKVIDRWEQDFGANLVARILSLISFSRWGLSESNLMEASKINPTEWSNIMAAIRLQLLITNGTLKFSHVFLSDAVKARYASIECQSREILVEYCSLDIHKLTIVGLEVPWQLSKILQIHLSSNPGQRNDIMDGYHSQLVDFVTDPVYISYFANLFQLGLVSYHCLNFF